MVTLSDRDADTGAGGYILGMNTRDDEKRLSQGECLLLENCIPGDPPKVRNGIVDIFTDTNAIDSLNSHTMYTPSAIRIVAPNGNEYIFAWVKALSGTEYCLEVIDIANHTRDALIRCTFNDEYVHCSMLKIYNSVYCMIDKEIVQNLTHPELKDNFIIYWNEVTWSVRSWGIGSQPKVSQVVVRDQSESLTAPAVAYTSVVPVLNEIVLTYGKGSLGNLSNVLVSTDMVRWDIKQIATYEYLTDDTGVFLQDYLENLNTEVFTPRSNHSSIYFKDKLWIFGGEDSNGNLLNDCWYTENSGTTWIVQNKNCAWSKRKDFTVVNFNERLYLIGGYDGSSALNDVWYSDDGFTWTQVSVSTPFTARYGHTALVYDDKIFIILGHGRTDVWYSSNGGLTWDQSTADAGAGSRKFHASIVYNEKMWIIGGLDDTTYKNDVKYSADGITWTTQTSSPAWTARAGHSVIEFRNKLFIYGGYDGSKYLSDCYMSIDGNIWEYSVGGLTKNKYYSTAFTYVRREDSLSKLSSIEDYNYEPWELVGAVQIVGIDEKLITGTVSLSGTGTNNLTGSGTLFSTELKIGDRIRIDGAYTYFTVTEIQDNTNATVSNVSGLSFTSKKCALLPDDGDPISTDNYNTGVDEGVEITENRVVFYNGSSTDLSKILFSFTNNLEAIAKGATHIREYRTLGAADTATVAGLDHKYVKDIAITSRNAQQGKYIRDDLPDAILTGETHFVETNGFIPPFHGRFITWDRERIWFSGGNGHWYYSVGASQDAEYPQKYASLFQASTQKIICDPDDGQRDTGAISYNGDLLLSKERKLFILDNSNPANVPRLLVDGIGFDFPNTITPVDHPTIQKAVFGISNQGPVVLSSGGTIEFLTIAKHEELWPKGLLFNNSNVEWKESVSAIWYNSSWIILVPNQSKPIIYGVHVDPSGETSGPYIETLASIEDGSFPNDPCVLIPKDNNVCYSLSSKDRVYRLSQYSKKDSFQDVYGENAYSYNMRISPKPFTLENNVSVFGEALFANILMSFKDNAGFTVTLICESERFRETTEYQEYVDSALPEGSYNVIRNIIQIVFKEGAYGKWFKLIIDKVVPSDGAVNYEGVMFNVELRQQFGPEFYGVSGERITGW